MSSSGDRWRLPPRIKVLEALGAIADGRVKVISPTEARVVSSTGERVYTVRFRKDLNAIHSDDNGSVYRGYLGYPALAFLMALGELPYDERIAEALRGIPWKRLNETYKSYAKVMDVVLARAEERGVERPHVERFIDRVMDILKARGYRKLEARQATLF